MYERYLSNQPITSMANPSGSTANRKSDQSKAGNRDQPGDRNRKQGREKQERDVQGGGGGKQGGGGGQK